MGLSRCPCFSKTKTDSTNKKEHSLTLKDPSTRYLVFGDLHGRVLPAFALARRYQDDFKAPLDGLLQVGDLGYFPDTSRLDAASRRHAAQDPLELGISEFNTANPVACRFFQYFDPLVRMYFIAGNHEDYESLERRRRSRDPAWPVDDFHRLWCLDDGRVTELSSGLKVGSLWGIDGDAPKARRIRLPRTRINPDAAEQLRSKTFDVLLTHESPRDAIWVGSGSELISTVIESAAPQIAFFGHYHTAGRLADCDFGRTRVYWMNGLELQVSGTRAESCCAGLLTRTEANWDFHYLDDDWIAGFTRNNWDRWLE